MAKNKTLPIYAKRVAARRSARISSCPKKLRGVRFTHNCYAIIAILVENPETIFSLTIQRCAERMVKAGLLTQRTIKLPQNIKDFHYEADFINFVPTDKGLQLFSELNALVKGRNLEDLKFVLRGEEIKLSLQDKLKG